MNIKVRAALNTAALFAVTALGVVAAISALQYFGNNAWYVFFAGLIGYFSWIVYSINLSQLQYQEKLTEIVNKSKE